MSNPATPTETPNVVVQDPRIRKGANIVLGVAGVVIGAAIVLDAASPELAYANVTGPASAVYVFLAGVFGLAVTTPNIPTR